MLKPRLLLIVLLGLVPLLAGAASKPPHPGALLGSHPSTSAHDARQTLLKRRSKGVPLIEPKPGKTANSLNTHPGKTITINRKRS